MSTHKYPKYTIHKKELYNAGEILRKGHTINNFQAWYDSYILLERWRSMHAYPMNTFQANIRRILKKNGLDKRAIVAQRLKRLPSILLKLSRFKTMRLERMQDIGGLRIILPTVNDVNTMRNALKASKWKHRLCREKDYITNPQESGYRSIHLIYEYNNIQAPPEYQGLHVEIQLRTKMQHIWATTVETIGTFIEHSLKSSQGPQEWLDYLKLAGEVFALEEKTNPHPNYLSFSPEELIEKLHKKTRELNTFQMLNTFHQAVRFNESRKFKNKYILLQIDVSNNRGYASVYNLKDLEKASNAYGDLERTQTNAQDAVLVSSSSLSELRKAYPNYFVDASEFIKQLSRIFKKYNLPDIPITKDTI